MRGVCVVCVKGVLFVMVMFFLVFFLQGVHTQFATIVVLYIDDVQ